MKNRPRKKILIFLQSGVGGAERMSVLIGKSLPTDLFEVTFCLVKKGKAQSAILNFIPDKYPIIEIKTNNAIAATWHIQKTIAKQNPDIVFSSVLYLNDKILPFRWLYPKTKFIIRCENYLYTFSSKQRQIVKATYQLADAIIAQTIEMKDELVKQCHIRSGKIYSLENPVDTETINQKLLDATNPYPDDGKKHILASGRFAYQKGFDLLVEAFAKLKKTNDNIGLYIVGKKDGNAEHNYNSIMQQCEKLGIIDSVHCLGFQDNPYIYMKYSDIFVLSSRWEGLPNVLVEAQYLGTPAAAFRCIPIVERIIKEGVNGFLAKEEDVEQLAYAMEQALKLGRIQSTYEGASIDDFTNVFQSVL